MNQNNASKNNVSIIAKANRLLVIFLLMLLGPNNSINTAATSTTLAITKSAPSSICPNSSISYTITVTNNGPSDATGITVTDILPNNITFRSGTGTGWRFTTNGQTITATNESIAAATSSTLTITGQVAAKATGTLNNQATVASRSPVFGPISSATVTTTINSASLSISQGAPSAVCPGSTFEYLIDVDNAGPCAVNGITVTDVLPNGVSFLSASAFGWIVSVSGQALTLINPSILANTSLNFIIRVQVSSNASGTLTNVVTLQSKSPILGPIQSNITHVAVNSTALSITKTGPATVTAGSNLTYTIAVKNNGSCPATGITVTDLLPNGLTFVSGNGTGWVITSTGQNVKATNASIAAGASSTFTITAQVSNATGVTLNNNASVRSASPAIGPVTSNTVATSVVTPATK